MNQEWAWQPLDDLCGEREENSEDGAKCELNIVVSVSSGTAITAKGDGITTCTRCGSSERLFYGLCHDCHSIMCATRPDEDMDIGV